MKILQVNCVYNKGSTGKITADLHNGLLYKGIDSIVLYGRGQKSNDPKVIKTCGEFESHLYKFISYFTGMPFSGCWFSTNKLLRIIKKEKPDIVHLQCLNGYFVNIYKLVSWLKKKNIKTVLTLHAEFMYTAGCGYALECEQWKNPNGCGYAGCPLWSKETHSLFFDKSQKAWAKMKRCFDGFNNLTVVSVSEWLANRAKDSKILSNKNHVVVYNGLDTDVFKYRVNTDLRVTYGLKDKKVIFHATPTFNSDVDNIKGGYYVLKLARMMPEITFVVAGPYKDDLQVPKNVILLGRVNNQELLAKWYSNANVTLLTSKRETFSMVVAESLCCGTPVVGFNAGAPEMIAIKEFSDFVEYGNVDLLKVSVENALYKKSDKEVISKLACKKYSEEEMVKNYIDVYTLK